MDNTHILQAIEEINKASGKPARANAILKHLNKPVNRSLSTQLGIYLSTLANKGVIQREVVGGIPKADGTIKEQHGYNIIQNGSTTPQTVATKTKFKSLHALNQAIK